MSKLQRAQKALEAQRAYMADRGSDLRGYWQAFGPRGAAYYAQDLADLRLADARYDAALRGEPFTTAMLLEHAATRHGKAAMTHDVVHYPHFAFCRTTFGSPAMCELAIATPAGGTPIVLAIERADNPGVSVTNGAEALAAAVLRVLPDRAGEHLPFRLVVHHPTETFALGDHDFEQLEGTHFEVSFADFRVRTLANGTQCVSDVVQWRTVERVELDAWGLAPQPQRRALEHGPGNGRNGAPQPVTIANAGEEEMAEQRQLNLFDLAPRGELNDQLEREALEAIADLPDDYSKGQALDQLWGPARRRGMRR